jgi:hypothetical protein
MIFTISNDATAGMTAAAASNAAAAAVRGSAQVVIFYIRKSFLFINLIFFL